MKADGYEDLERELAEVFEAVERNPHDHDAVMRLSAVLDRQYGQTHEERDWLDTVLRTLAQGGDLSEDGLESLISSAQLTLYEYRNGW